MPESKIILDALLAKVKAPIPPSSDPKDPKYVAEKNDYELQEKEAKLSDYKQDIQLRKSFSERIFWLFVTYLAVIILILVASGLTRIDFVLSDNVLIALLTTTTANIIGVLIIVARYIFPKR
jgi:hypothetical protein